MQEEKSRSMSELPDEVRDFLLEPALLDCIDEIREKHALAENTEDVLIDFAEQITLGSFSLELLPQKISAELHIEESKAKQIAIDLAGHRLLPIAPLIGDVAQQIVVWGGNLEDFAHIPKVEIHIFSPEYVVRETLGEAHLNTLDPKLQDRLEFIFTSYLKGKRNETEIKEVLMRSSKVGGMDLDSETADRLLILFRDKQKFAKINFHSQEESSTSTPTVLVKKTEKPIQLEKKESSVPEPKAKMEVLFAKEDEQEITRLTSFVQENLPPVSQLDVSLKDAVIQVIREANLDLKDEEIKKRFVSLVEARLRDVRDPYETRSQLEYPSEKGGLGLSGLTLVRTLECIERIFGERQNLLKDQVNKQKAVMVEQKKQEEAERESLARKEASTLTKRYIEMTGKIPTESIQPASVSGTRVTTAMSLQEAAIRREEKIDKQKVKEAFTSAKPVAPVIVPRLSQGSISSVSTPRPQVEDIKFVRKLSGPLEELEQMTLTEFRRLSRDPKEAVLKLKDKIDLLEEQGYEKKIHGIKAWRESPLNRLYLELFQEALRRGRPLQEIADERRTANQNMLTAGEIDVLVDLNAYVRF